MEPMILTDLEAVEVSLVDEAANRRRFLLLKNEAGRSSGPALGTGEGGENVNRVLKALLETEAEGEKKLLKQMLTDEDGEPIDVPEEAKEALTGAIRLLLAYQDELPDDLVRRLMALLEEPPPPAEGEPAPDDAAAASEPVAQQAEGSREEEEEAVQQRRDDAINKRRGRRSFMPVKKADGSYDLSGIPADMRPVIEALWKEHETAVAKAKQLEATLKAERDERLTKEFVEKAAALKSLPMNPAEMGPVFKKLAEAAPKEWAAVEGVLKAANEQLAKSALFHEFGTAGGAASGSAWGRVVQMADQMVRKAENGLTREQAIAKVLEQHPDLYTEYLEERSGVN